MKKTQPRGMTRRDFVQGASLLACAPLADPSAAAPGKRAGGAGSDWPTYRHDGRLSATSPLKGGLAKQPEVAWSLDLGGPAVPAERIQVADVDGDGREEFLALDAAAVTCRDARGKQLWKLEGYLRPEVVDIRDFRGDGSRGILLKTSVAGRVDTWMVDGGTGKTVRLWRDENNFGGALRYGKILPDVPGAQIAATSSGQTPPAPWGGHVRLVSFEQGLTEPHFHIRKFVEGMLYAPLILFADLDADGRAEMAIVSHEELWTFDPKTGEQKFQARFAPAIRSYWSNIAAVRLAPEDRFLSLVMINPFIPGLEAVRQDGKTAATRLWKTLVGEKEDQYQIQVQIEPGGPDPVCDLDGDGRYEVLALITGEHGEKERRLAVFDARDGRRLGEVPDARVLVVEDLDGDGKPEVVLKQGKQLQVARWTGSAFQVLWQAEGVEPLLRPLPPEGSLARSAGGATPLWREAADPSSFLLRFPKGVRSCRLTAAGVVPGSTVAVHEALGNVPPKPGTERVVWDGKTVTTHVDAREVYRYTPPAPQTYLAPPALAADLAGKRQILVRDGEGRYRLCPADGSGSRIFIERPYEKFQTHVDPAGAGPAISDVDADGRNEVVATVSGPDGIPYCAILDEGGRMKRRLELQSGTQTVNRGPTGSLGPGKGRWILLRMFYGEGVKPGRLPLVVAYDGKTGERLWTRDHYSHYGPNPVVFAAHLPTAVWDYDGDGADDWIVCSENFYGIVNVKDNRDLVGPVNLSDAVPGHWTAYSYPSVGDLRGDGRVALFHHNSYSLTLVTDLEGKPLWHRGMTRDTAGAWGMLADLDGDGRLEALHVQPDGVIRCFSPEPDQEKCPTCPAEGAPGPVSRSGRERWTLDMKRPVSRMAAADLDGDGRFEVLFGGDEGKLQALGERNGRPQILWSVPFGRRVGEPILADLDLDGRAEILVPVEDGRLYCLRGKRRSKSDRK
jgi:hypothetical protein